MIAKGVRPWAACRRDNERRARARGQKAREGLALKPMRAVKAVVKNGRLVVDEPTDRPEGEVVELVPLDEVRAGVGDCLDDEERAHLHRELEASVIEADGGNLSEVGRVFVLFHVHEGDDGSEDAKLIGVYSSEVQAKEAMSRAALQPGFRDHPVGFAITPYEFDVDHWTEGFISWREATM